MKTAALTSTDAISTRIFRKGPREPVLLAPSVDRAVVPRTASPAVARSSRLRARALKGFGRLFFGTIHAVFIAFWRACATPSPP